MTGFAGYCRATSVPDGRTSNVSEVKNIPYPPKANIEGSKRTEAVTAKTSDFLSERQNRNTLTGRPGLSRTGSVRRSATLEYNMDSYTVDSAKVGSKGFTLIATLLLLLLLSGIA